MFGLVKRKNFGLEIKGKTGEKKEKCLECDKTQEGADWGGWYVMSKKEAEAPLLNSAYSGEAKND